MRVYKDKLKEIELISVDKWRQHCPPVSPTLQWVDKRSAKEMAKFWTDIGKRGEFLMFLRSVKKDLTFDYALPEIATKFDAYKSPRKNDLCLYATYETQRALISIEGKSDEQFGKRVADEWSKSILEKISKPNSKKLDRIIELYQRFECNPDFLKLKYQLTYWLAGAIDGAIRNDIDIVFLIVQEFYSDLIKERKVTNNQHDLDFFLSFISNSFFKKVRNNEIIGPINNPFTKQIDLYIGKYQHCIF